MSKGKKDFRGSLDRLLSERTDPSKIDRIVEALTGGPSPMFRVSEEEETRTIWDDSRGIGLRFRKGERLSRYLLTDVVPHNLLTTEDGMRILDETRHRLLNFAIENFPEEFGTEIH